MAARGEKGRIDGVFGNMRFVTGTFDNVGTDTRIDDTDTWTPGLAVIANVIITQGTANPTATEMNATWSTPANRQAVITFDTEAADNVCTVTAFGW